MKSVFSFVGALSLFFSFTLAPAAVGGPQERRIYYPPAYSNFTVDVLIGGVPAEKLYGRGRSYVEAFEGAEYELRVRNPLPVRVAVALSVDGLNTIDARRTSSWDAKKWVIEPYGTIRIGGWQMSTERARRFYFTTERDSYAARLGRASDLGIITAVFYREAGPAVTYGRPRPYPSDDPRRSGGEDDRQESARNAPAPRGANAGKGQADRSAAPSEALRTDDDYAATGIGRSVNNHVYRVDMSLERRPAAEVTIRYEYRPALVRLGLLPRPRPYNDEDTLRRRERARGFNDTDFSPEP